MVSIWTWIYNDSTFWTAMNHKSSIVSSKSVKPQLSSLQWPPLSLFKNVKCVAQFHRQRFTGCCSVAGRLGSFVSTALQCPESELPDGPAGPLWRSVVFSLYMSPPVGQRGSLQGAEAPGGAGSDTRLPSLPSGTGPWHIALARGWRRYMSTQSDINRDKTNLCQLTLETVFFSLPAQAKCLLFEGLRNSKK